LYGIFFSDGLERKTNIYTLKVEWRGQRGDAIRGRRNLEGGVYE